MKDELGYTSATPPAPELQRYVVVYDAQKKAAGQYPFIVVDLDTMLVVSANTTEHGARSAALNRNRGSDSDWPPQNAEIKEW